MRERDFVERMGEHMASSGHPRIAGRLLGWLLICEPPEQSAADLAEAIGASKASISNMTRLLTAGGCIERTGRPGDRKVYFRIRPQTWSEMLVARLSAIAELREIAAEGLAVLGDADVERRARLEAMHDLYAFFAREMPSMVERFEAERAAAERDRSGGAVGARGREER